MNMVWMMNDGDMMSGDKCGLNYLTFILQLKKNHNQETDLNGDRTHAHC